jgi:hypothetical protein
MILSCKVIIYTIKKNKESLLDPNKEMGAGTEVRVDGQLPICRTKS